MQVRVRGRAWGVQRVPHKHRRPRALQETRDRQHAPQQDDREPGEPGQRAQTQAPRVVAERGGHPVLQEARVCHGEPRRGLLHKP